MSQKSLSIEIRELKQLLDDKIITKKEFEAKKKDLLNLPSEAHVNKKFSVKCPHCNEVVEIEGEGMFECMACKNTFAYSQTTEKPKETSPERMSRGSFFIFQLIGWTISFFGYLFFGEATYDTEIWIFIWAMVLMALQFYAVRLRLHDLNLSTLYILLLLVPAVNLFFYLYLLLEKGTEGENRYGPMPN